MRALGVALVLAMVGAVASYAAPARRPQPAPTWHLTVYYTAVASLHDGPHVEVVGCAVRDCENGSDHLGSYPESFVSAVMEEGTGRIDVGPNAGRYLEWSDGIGYWLDDVALDSHGGRLVPFVTAAADARVLREGATFTITGCGRQDGDPLDPRVCRRIRQARWRVRDEFTPGLGGRRHVDLYIGEERGRDFTDVSPMYFDATGARLQIGKALASN